MPRMNQLLDTITPVESKRYMHHYNFPPFSTGETGFMRGPKRREIGHGLLAERALLPVVPSAEEFPYTLRVVSDVLASNGSTSMASVCGSTLSLMAAGVPLKAPVAGIAMGLVYDGGTYVTLTDILGSEDAFGDMDFKVAGTADAVTALQLDTKIDGLPADVLAKALLQAKEARLTILEVMAGAIAEPRDHVANERAEDRLHGDPDRQDRRGHRAQGQGHQHPAAGDRGRHRGRRRRRGRHGDHRRQGRQRGRRGAAAHLAHPRPADGRGRGRLPGKVVNITKFGAFVNMLPGRDGLLHISKLSSLAGGKRINNVEDVLVARARRSRSGSTTSTRRARCPSRWPSAPEGGTGDVGHGDRGRPGTPAVAGARARLARRRPRAEPSGLSFEDAFEAELVADLGDLGPGAAEGDSGRGGDRGDRDRDRGNDRRPSRGRSRRR